MKVLDPQSALLTTAEVHQFLRDTPVREKDKKVGAYEGVNVVNYHLVRRDVEHYTSLVLPQIKGFPPVDSFMHDLLLKLKKYELTKAEVYTLINLGVGLDKSKKTTASVELNGEAKGESNGVSEQPDDEEDADDSELGKSLFKVIVEEWEERFPEPDGEAKIDEVLAILKDNLQHNEKETDKTRGTNGTLNGT